MAAVLTAGLVLYICFKINRAVSSDLLMRRQWIDVHVLSLQLRHDLYTKCDLNYIEHLPVAKMAAQCKHVLINRFNRFLL